MELDWRYLNRTRRCSEPQLTNFIFSSDPSFWWKIKLEDAARKLTYPVIIEETNNLERGPHKDSINTSNWSEGSKPNIPDMVLFMASTVVGGTSF